MLSPRPHTATRMPTHLGHSNGHHQPHSAHAPMRPSVAPYRSGGALRRSMPPPAAARRAWYGPQLPPPPPPLPYHRRWCRGGTAWPAFAACLGRVFATARPARRLVPAPRTVAGCPGAACQAPGHGAPASGGGIHPAARGEGVVSDTLPSERPHHGYATCDTRRRCRRTRDSVRMSLWMELISTEAPADIPCRNIAVI